MSGKVIAFARAQKPTVTVRQATASANANGVAVAEGGYAWRMTRPACKAGISGAKTDVPVGSVTVQR